MMNLGVPGTGGTCCPCADQSGCECNKCTLLECRSRGGVVRLCGFDEFDSASTPPRFYLEKEIGGSAVLCRYNSPPGKGPCYADPCPNPIGLSVAINTSWDCPGGTPGVPDRFAGMTMECIGVGPGSGSNVVLEFRLTSTASGSSGVGVSWLGYINSTLFSGGFTAPGTVVSKSEKANNTALGFSCEVAASCSPSGSFGGSPSPSCLGSECDSGSQPITWCIPATDSTRYLVSGVQKYDPAISCDKLNIDTFERTTIDAPKGCNPPESGGTTQVTSTAFDPALSAYVELDTGVSSRTLRQEKTNGLCSNDASVTSSDRYEELKSEDTEEDAFLRLLSGAGGIWSAWTTVGDGTGGTCLNPPCCQAEWEIRTYRTLAYREAEFRATIGGLYNGQLVDITIRVYRRAYGSGDLYEWFEDLIYDNVAASGGTDDDTPNAHAQIEDEVPNAEGFETYVTCTFTAPT